CGRHNISYFFYAKEVNIRSVGTKTHSNNRSGDLWYDSATTYKVLPKFSMEHPHRNPSQNRYHTNPFPIQRDWNEIGKGLVSHWKGIGNE
ncbi:MAG TPA: hypothetical protein PKK33_08205, partial [Candidatus Cloacimonadota bacterium]|nr:hypothetical protein [Candidatus Cloacimonadota bacterium]